MATKCNDSFQIHNYSFAAIEAFILEVKKYPIIYKEQSKDMDMPWSMIVTTLLENGADYTLTLSQRIYWERIYRGLWMWMRHILTRDMVGRYLGQSALSKNPKYSWLDYLKFVEPFIQLGENSFHYDADLDPFIHLQVFSTEEVAKTVYCDYMVYWKQSQEELGADTYYISICVHTVENLGQFLQNINGTEDKAEVAIPSENTDSVSPILSTTPNDMTPEEVTNFIEEQLMSYLTEDTGYDDFLSGYISGVEKHNA
ncbi:uncharacterized protein LOC129906026 [Episyrphus balteatus]|uniref:uncharacterized protein LOC129906026 n=1 Tax=Episyrphus balteatus TaxID=286459 RepID=UPI002486366B|nr:uncharacterized protein LOC129906026 [Episyrphus balteatus]